MSTEREATQAVLTAIRDLCDRQLKLAETLPIVGHAVSSLVSYEIARVDFICRYYESELARVARVAAQEKGPA